MDESVKEYIEKTLKVLSVFLLFILAGSLFAYQRADKKLSQLMSEVDLVALADARTPIFLNESDGMDLETYKKIDEGIYNVFNYRSTNEQRKGIIDFMGEDVVGIFIPFDDGTDEQQKGIGEKRRTFISDKGNNEYLISTYILSNGNQMYLQQEFTYKNGKFTRKDTVIATYNENIMKADEYLKLKKGGE